MSSTVEWLITTCLQEHDIRSSDYNEDAQCGVLNILAKVHHLNIRGFTASCISMQAAAALLLERLYIEQFQQFYSSSQ